MAGIKPVENEGAGTAHMQKSCRRRRESDTKHNLRVYGLGSRRLLLAIRFSLLALRFSGSHIKFIDTAVFDE